MALNMGTAKTASDAYAIPSKDVRKIPYALGLPIPQGLQLKTASKPPTMTPGITTTAPATFDHRKAREPKEPEVPIPLRNDPKINNTWKPEDAKASGSYNVAALPRLDAGTGLHYMRFCEAYKAPVPEDARWQTSRQNRCSPAKCQKRKTKDKIFSALGRSKVRSDKRINCAGAKVVSMLGGSVDRVDRIVNGTGNKIRSGLRDSAHGIGTLTSGAERRLQHPISSVHTRLAKAKANRDPRHVERHTFPDRAGHTHMLAIHRGIAPGEVEHTIRAHDWTKHFDCAMSLTQYSWLTGKTAAAALYFNDLPARLKGGVPWNRPSLTKLVKEEIYREITCECCQGREWVSRTAWRERGPAPRFAAVITVGHLTRLEALDLDPFEIMRDARVNMAEMDLRTGPGRFRKVMQYKYRGWFGNDLNKDFCENSTEYFWEEMFAAEFVEFFGRLFQSS